MESKRRSSSSGLVPAQLEPAYPHEEPAGDWDDDRDPNDIVPAPPPAASGAVIPTNMYDEWENDEWEAD